MIKQLWEQRLVLMRQIKINQFFVPIQFLQKQHQNTHAQPMDTKSMELVGQLASKVFKQKVTILQVGAGKGQTTNAFLSKFGPCKQYIGTDLHHSCQSPKILAGISSREAVQKFGKKCDCLLIIFPPPNCSMDYVAISQFQKLQNSKYLIYIGQMGATDGCPGIYSYLFQSTKWKLIHRKLLSKTKVTFIVVEVELFIFERKN